MTSAYTDAAALAGQTFYRAAAASGTGGYAYCGIMNPPGSGIDTLIDAFFLWPGVPGVAAEIGVMHYATPFNAAPFTNVILNELLPTRYGKPVGLTQFWAGTQANWPLTSRIDYVEVGPSSEGQPMLEKPPYPIILVPGDGIVFGNPSSGYELKLGVWLRELPAS